MIINFGAVINSYFGGRTKIKKYKELWTLNMQLQTSTVKSLNYWLSYLKLYKNLDQLLRCAFVILVCSYAACAFVAFILFFLMLDPPQVSFYVIFGDFWLGKYTYIWCMFGIVNFFYQILPKKVTLNLI